MTKLKKYRKLKGIEKMKNDQKKAHILKRDPYISYVIIYLRFLNKKQIEYIYKCLDEKLYETRKHVKYVHYIDKYYKKNPEELENEPKAKEILNRQRHNLFKYNYFISDLKDIKKEVYYYIENYDFIKNYNFQFEDENKLNNLFNNYDLIEPWDFYEKVVRIIFNYHTSNTNKKRFKTIEKLKKDEKKKKK